MSDSLPSSVASLFSLAGRVALILGGTGVLGLALAHALGRFGARVALSGRDEGRVSRAIDSLAEHKIEAIGLIVDAMDKRSIELAVQRTEKELGPVQILVNAVGGNRPEATAGPDRSFFDLPAEGMEHVVGLNLFAGAIFPCQVVGRRMAAHGLPSSIINVSSMAALTPLTRVVGYSAAKASVENFTRWFAVYLARDLHVPVRVNAIAPGFFMTEQNRFLLTTETGGITERGRSILEHTPAGRFGHSDDLAGAAVWLASDASAFVTGAIIPVDGGFSAFSGV